VNLTFSDVKKHGIHRLPGIGNPGGAFSFLPTAALRVNGCNPVYESKAPRRGTALWRTSPREDEPQESSVAGSARPGSSGKIQDSTHLLPLLSGLIRNSGLPGSPWPWRRERRITHGR